MLDFYQWAEKVGFGMEAKEEACTDTACVAGLPQKLSGGEPKGKQFASKDKLPMKVHQVTSGGEPEGKGTDKATK